MMEQYTVVRSIRGDHVSKLFSTLDNLRDTVLWMGAQEYHWSIRGGSDIWFIQVVGHVAWTPTFSSSGEWLSHWLCKQRNKTNRTYKSFRWIFIWRFASKTCQSTKFNSPANISGYMVVLTLVVVRSATPSTLTNSSIVPDCLGTHVMFLSIRVFKYYYRKSGNFRVYEVSNLYFCVQIFSHTSQPSRKFKAPKIFCCFIFY